MKITLFLISSLLVVANAREFPDDGVHYEACLEELVRADANQDDAIKIEEYDDFVQAYTQRILCEEEGDDEKFTSEHREAFQALACMCRCRQGRACCEGDNAEISTAGATDGRTTRQHYYLTTVCQVTENSIPGTRCSDDSDSSDSFTSVEEQADTTSVRAGNSNSVEEQTDTTSVRAGNSNSNNNKNVKIGAIVAASMAVVVAVLLVAVLRRRGRRQMPANDEKDQDETVVVDEQEVAENDDA